MLARNFRGHHLRGHSSFTNREEYVLCGRSLTEQRRGHARPALTIVKLLKVHRNALAGGVQNSSELVDGALSSWSAV